MEMDVSISTKRLGIWPPKWGVRHRAERDTHRTSKRIHKNLVFFRKLERSESNLAVLNCQTHFGDHNKPGYTQHLQVLPHFHEHGGSSSAISVTKSSISTTDGVTRQRFISLDTSTSSVVTGRREAAVSRVTRHGQSGGVGNR